VYVLTRGLGRSSPARGPADLTNAQAVRDLEAVRRALGAPSWVLEGFSGGSVTALRYATTYPGAVTGLVCGFASASAGRLVADYGERSVLSPRHPAYRDVLDPAALRAAPRESTAAGAADDFWAEVRPGTWVLVQAGAPRFVWPAGPLSPHKKARAEEGLALDLSDRLGAIAAPALLVAGRHDPAVPLEAVQDLHRRLPDAELLVLERSGHGVAAADAAVFRTAVLRFLRRVAAESTRPV
jgi:proline iminopeptidase